MVRHEFITNDYDGFQGEVTIAYGYDHAVGYFIMVYPYDIEDFEPDMEDLLLDLDTTFDSLTGSQLATMLRDYGCKNLRHIDAARMDNKI